MVLSAGSERERLALRTVTDTRLKAASREGARTHTATSSSSTRSEGTVLFGHYVNGVTCRGRRKETTRLDQVQPYDCGPLRLLFFSPPFLFRRVFFISFFFLFTGCPFFFSLLPIHSPNPTLKREVDACVSMRRERRFQLRPLMRRGRKTKRRRVVGGGSKGRRDTPI